MKTTVKRAWREQLERTLIIAFVVIIVLLPAHAFFSTWLGTTIGPLLVWKSWKEIVIVGLAILVTSYCILRPDTAKTIWARPVNKLIAVYVILHFGMAVVSSPSSEAIIAGLLINLRFLAMFVLAQVIIVSSHPWIDRLKTSIPSWLLWTMLGLSVLAILQVTVLPKDLLMHFGYAKDATISPIVLVDDNPDALRAFATLRGPNTLGSYLVLPLIVAAYYLLKRQRIFLAAPALALGLSALFLTGSRSAWIGFAVALAIMGLLFVPRASLRKWIKLAAVPTLLLGGLFVWASINVPMVRLAIFHSSPHDPYLLEGSTEKHGEAVVSGLQSIVQNPFGLGPGSAGPASFYNTNSPPTISESYFVQIGQEVGILGLILFLFICGYVARLLYRQKVSMAHMLLASFIGLSVINIFLHGWADDPTAMTWWGLAGLFVAGNHQTLWGSIKIWFNKHKG